MYIDCRGRGSPTVVLDAGLGVDAGSTWARVQPPVSRITGSAGTTAAGWAAATRAPSRGPACAWWTSCARSSALERNGEGVTYADLLASDAQVSSAGPLPPVRMVVLRHGVSFDPGGEPDPRVERLWTALQKELAARSPLGRYVRVPGSHHRIAEDRPAAVVDAIEEVIDAARSS